MSMDGLELIFDLATSFIEAIIEEGIEKSEEKIVINPETPTHLQEEITIEKVEPPIKRPAAQEQPEVSKKRVVNRKQLKQMMIYKEILDPPLSMREERGR